VVYDGGLVIAKRGIGREVKALYSYLVSWRSFLRGSCFVVFELLYMASLSLNMCCMNPLHQRSVLLFQSDQRYISPWIGWQIQVVKGKDTMHYSTYACLAKGFFGLLACKER
jgi:hypothetical protein